MGFFWQNVDLYSHATDGMLVWQIEAPQLAWVELWHDDLLLRSLVPENIPQAHQVGTSELPHKLAGSVANKVDSNISVDDQLGLVLLVSSSMKGKHIGASVVIAALMQLHSTDYIHEDTCSTAVIMCRLLLENGDCKRAAVLVHGKERDDWLSNTAGGVLWCLGLNEANITLRITV